MEAPEICRLQSGRSVALDIYSRIHALLMRNSSIILSSAVIISKENCTVGRCCQPLTRTAVGEGNASVYKELPGEIRARQTEKQLCV
eukprot:scaffold72397_cov16-Prasinocladus_malaysianus.AAC.1